MKPIIATFLTAIACLAAATLAPAADFQQAAAKADSDLQKALGDLANLQDSIAKEKIPLAKELNKLEDTVIKQRSELAKQKGLATKAEAELIILRQQVKSYNDQSEYIGGLLTDFINNFGGRLDISERSSYDAKISDARLAPGNPDLTEAQVLQKQVEILKASIARLDEVIGGNTYTGKAQGNEGNIRDGGFVKVGPVVYFSSNDGSSAGITQEEINNENPVVYVPSEEAASAISAVVKSGSGNLPVDPTLGDAIRVAEVKKSLQERLEQGGVIGYVIVGLGVISVLLALFKVFEVGTFSTPSNKLVGEILNDLDNGNTEGAMEKAKGVGGIGTELLQTGIENLNLSRAIIEELLFEKILKCRPNLERFLNFIAITAAAAPLLGLLGTVTGMIRTFDLITVYGTGDAKSLSSGISEALITTALGLIVAIPTLILHGGLARLAKRKLGQMEQTALAFVNGISKTNTTGNPDEVTF